MKLRTLTIFLIMLLPITAAAQFTQVSATVTDPNGLPYANGTVVAKLILPGGTSPTLNGLAYTPPSQPVGLNSAGFFLMQIADNNVLLPAATQWTFTVCSAAGTVQPAGGRGPLCFNAGPLTITGTAQNITATLNAAALALAFSGTGSVTANNTGQTNVVAVYPLDAGSANVTAPTSNLMCVPGATSGESCWTAPNVAGTSTNAWVSTNVIQAPPGNLNSPAYGFSSGCNNCGLDNDTGQDLLLRNNTVIVLWANSAPNVRFGGGGTMGFSNTTGAGPNCDTCSSRLNAGTWGFGNGTQGDTSGQLIGNGGFGESLKATAAITGPAPVKADTANANQVIVTVTTDTGAGIVIGVCTNSPAAGANCNVITSGIAALVLGTGTCAIGNFVIVDTTTNARTKCTATYTAGTVIGVAMAAQNTVGNSFNVMVGLR